MQTSDEEQEEEPTVAPAAPERDHNLMGTAGWASNGFCIGCNRDVHDHLYEDDPEQEVVACLAGCLRAHQQASNDMLELVQEPMARGPIPSPGEVVRRVSETLQSERETTRRQSRCLRWVLLEVQYLMMREDVEFDWLQEIRREILVRVRTALGTSEMALNDYPSDSD
jgi:hypothetical protein